MKIVCDFYWMKNIFVVCIPCFKYLCGLFFFGRGKSLIDDLWINCDPEINMQSSGHIRNCKMNTRYINTFKNKYECSAIHNSILKNNRLLL